MVKTIGLRIPPCGTQAVRFSGGDSSFPILTCCVRPVRNELNQAHVSSLHPCIRDVLLFLILWPTTRADLATRNLWNLWDLLYVYVKREARREEGRRRRRTGRRSHQERGRAASFR